MTTVVLLITPRPDQAQRWQQLLTERLDDVDFRVYPEVGDASAVEVALAWKPPHGALARLPNLKLICSLGMGVDHLLEDRLLPRGVPIARLVDPNLVEQMSEYALYAVLHFHRRFDAYERLQAERRWEELPLPHTASRRVGIMGIGAIGGECARRIADIGFPVHGWSRSPKQLPGIECFHGDDQMDAFLARSDILLTVLPLTAQTAGIIDARALSAMPRGSFFVNVARGGLVVERDLLDSLDSGQIAGAMLDVTQIEPLPADHPFWTHPGVRITPHIAGLTHPDTAIVPIADNIRRLRGHRPLRDRVDPARGY